ncbi:MAG: CAP domain-containing protein [Planctomycetes bacterium]|nr:CAP domain-containing protein [Planctomycetota bacterium]
MLLKRLPILLITLLSVAPGLPAQNPGAGKAQASPAKDEADTNRRAIEILMRYASNARSNKVGPRAKLAYDTILQHYDSDHTGARQALGYKGKKGEWQEPRPPLEWADKANDQQRYRVWNEWTSTAKQLAKLHREHGLKVMQEAPVQGVFHLKRAISYDPFDKESHQALGHQEGEGIFGTPEDIAFVARLREIEKTALVLAKKEYKVEPVKELPPEAAQSGLEFAGAKSEHFTVFTRGTQENADNIVKWGERTIDFMEYLLGEAQAKKLKIRERHRFLGATMFVWTDTEKTQFVQRNPQILQGERSAEVFQRFMNVDWARDRRVYRLVQRLTPAMMHDYMIASSIRPIVEECNGPLAEGLIHACTWYLMSTSITQRGSLPEGTVGSAGLALPESTNWWLRNMRDNATAGTDFPISGVPRVRFDRFPNDARVKSWSFMTWALARYPDKWYALLTGLPQDKVRDPEDVKKLAAEILGAPLDEVEAEWREWAAGRSATAAATGYGPPLLPEMPNNWQLEGLKRLNELRAQANLLPCELDAEATVACQEHAEYLTRYPDQHKWPEAHEQDPAREGFTPRGMRAGMRSVIVIGTNDAAGSIDGWIGTIYHRFPLLEPHIRRIGLAVHDQIVVLDMGSLEEPRDPSKEPKWILWPVDNAKNVPVHFHGREYPNPLEEKGYEDTTTAGYPISIQFSRVVAEQIASATMAVYEVKKRGKAFERGEQVEGYVHAPQEPVLKRMEIKEAVCFLPKAFLKPNTMYEAEVVFTAQLGEEKVTWRFTTGSR